MKKEIELMEKIKNNIGCIVGDLYEGLKKYDWRICKALVEIEDLKIELQWIMAKAEAARERMKVSQ